MGAIPSIEFEPNSTYTITITKTCASAKVEPEAPATVVSPEAPAAEPVAASAPKSTQTRFIPLDVNRPATLDRPLLNIDVFAPILEVGTRDADPVCEGDIAFNPHELSEYAVNKATRDRELQMETQARARVRPFIDDGDEDWVAIERGHEKYVADVFPNTPDRTADTNAWMPQETTAMEKKIERLANEKYRKNIIPEEWISGELEKDYREHTGTLGDKDIEIKVKEFRSRYKWTPPRPRPQIVSRGKIIEFDDFELAAELGMGYDGKDAIGDNVDVANE